MKEISQTVILLVWRLSITVWNCFVFRNVLLHFFHIEKSSLKCPRIKKGDNIENRKELEARMKVRAKEFATIKNTFKVTHIIKTKKKKNEWRKRNYRVI